MITLQDMLAMWATIQNADGTLSNSMKTAKENFEKRILEATMGFIPSPNNESNQQ